MLDIAICDNNLSKLETLEIEIVKTLFDENEINIDLYDKYEEFEDIIPKRSKYYDLVFLFLGKNKELSFQAAENLRKYSLDSEIIFLSEDPTLVLKTFDYKPLGYLVIPFKSNDFTDLFERYRFYHNRHTEDFFTFKTNGVSDNIKIKSICYFCSVGRKVLLVAHDIQIEFYAKLDEIEELLKGKHFVRAHQSYLVNMAYIKYIIGNSLVLENGENIPISRNRMKSARETYTKYLM